MADNFNFTEGSGAVGAADDVSNVLYPRVKLDIGTDGVGTPVVGGTGAVAAGVPRVTLASDDPAVALLITIDSDTNTIQSDTTSIDGKITACNTGAVVLATGSAAIGKLAANSGVDIGDVTLTAGTAAIGKLAANSGVDIGDVDVTSVIAGVGATNLGKARDSALGATDTGVMALAVRDDTLTTLTPADGDYVPLRVSSTGQLHVTGAGGGTEYTEDVATANPQVGSAIMMERDDALTTVTPVEGDWIGLRGTAEGALWTQDFNSDAILSDTNAMVTDLAAIEVLLGTIDTDTGVIAGDTTSIDGKITACNTGAVVISSGTVTTVSTVTAITSLDKSVYVDDADWTDDTSSHTLVGGVYQSSPHTVTNGDVSPFGVDVNGNIVLGTGAKAIGKLAANSGVDIGDVDVTSVVPGTGATNLGKAIDNAVGATDTGFALLGQHNSDTIHLTTAEGDYDVLRLSEFGALQTQPEQHYTFDSLNATTGWSALSNDTLNLATTKKHVTGTDALTFDKVNGAANTVFAGIQKTISSVDLGNLSPHDLIQTACYIPDLTNVSYVFVRVGTDSSNYNEWRISGIDLTAAVFTTLLFNIGDANYAGITGNGWTSAAITYIVVGVAFDAETNTLAGIVFDGLSFHTNQHTSAELNAEVSSSVSTANVNLHKIGGSATDKNSGNKSNGSQRVVIASDDVNVLKITNAVEIMDDWDAVHDSAASSDGPQLMAAYDATKPAAVGDGDAVRVLADEYGRLLAGVEKTAWHATLNSADATGAAVVVKASAASTILVIQSYVISSDIEGWGHLVDEDDTVLTGKFWLKAGGGVAITLPDKAPIIMGVDKDLEFRCEAAGDVSVSATGYTIPG